MKFNLKLFIVSFVLPSTFNVAISQDGSGNNKGFTIKGHINGLEDGQEILLQVVEAGNWNFRDIDSATVKNKEFFFKGIVPEGPRTFWLHLNHPHPFPVIVFTMDNSEDIIISSDKNYKDIPHGYLQHWVDIKGNVSDIGWRGLATGYRAWAQSVAIVDKQIKNLVNTGGFDYPVINQLYTFRTDVTYEFYTVLLKSPEPEYRPAIPDLANAMFEKSRRAAFWGAVYDSLDEHLKNSWAGKLLKEKLSLIVGQPFPLFTLPTIDSKMLVLKDVSAKSKLTLVQFYAFNSVEVDRYQQELLVHYKKYHTKGLNIVGVCSDTSAKKWKIAAADLPWEQVSDLKGENGIVGKVYKEYGEHGAPQQNTTNVLIDQDGKIVAWDVNGPELQWYLWKTFGE